MNNLSKLKLKFINQEFQRSAAAIITNSFWNIIFIEILDFIRPFVNFENYEYLIKF